MKEEQEDLPQWIQDICDDAKHKEELKQMIKEVEGMVEPFKKIIYKKPFKH